MTIKKCKFLMIWALIFVTKFSICESGFRLADNCRVFCEGPLLDTIQKAHMFVDSKDFVDMPLVHDPNITLLAFHQLTDKNNRTSLKEFVATYFSAPGTELEACHQTDWRPEPAEFDAIKDPIYRQWAYDVHMKWRILCRRMKDDVRRHQEKYSLIYMPYPFVAPGGRFREFYYWDTYWIVKGLLASGMYNSTRLVIQNLAEMVRKYGFVPNGGRIYYLKRSQPPLFAPCVYEYYKATKDLEFVRQMLPLIERESIFWKNNRQVQWRTRDGEHVFKFYHYKVDAVGPRPESYWEDIETASHASNAEGKKQIWSDIAAACESGWDFSSRWFTRNTSYQYANSLRGIRTSRVVPVDLNSFICWNEAIMADLYTAIGNYTQAFDHESKHEYMRFAIHKAFWNPDRGTWFDLDLDSGEQREDYYGSNPTPLFASCYHNSKYVHKRVLQYLTSAGAMLFAGGLPTSFNPSNEQWDSPNGWAPTNHMAVEALRKSNDPAAQEAAFQLANRWIQTNYFVYVRTGGKMFEKYNIERIKSKPGGGGEYEVQEGFGWTNGVILDLLLTYGDRLRAPPVPPFDVESPALSF